MAKKDDSTLSAHHYIYLIQNKNPLQHIFCTGLCHSERTFELVYERRDIETMQRTNLGEKISITREYWRSIQTYQA